MAGHWLKYAPDHWRYIDRDGKVAIDIDVKWSIYARDFSEGLAAIYVEDSARFECLSGVNQNVREKYNDSNPYVSRQFCGRWGFIDTAGNFAVEPHFIEAFSFSEGLAAVRVRNPNVEAQKSWLYGYIDRTGVVVIAPQFEAAFDFSDGIARVVVDGRKGFIDKTGRRVTEATFDDAKDFHEGLAQVKIGDRWGYIDKTGKMAIRLSSRWPADSQRDWPPRDVQANLEGTSTAPGPWSSANNSAWLGHFPTGLHE